MSELILVRHGQAAAFSENSDRLTELGQRQAEALGHYLVARGVEVDEVHSGTLERQRHTEALVGELYRKAGRSWPEAQRNAGWNEYDSGGVTRRLAPLLAARDPGFAALQADFQTHAGSRQQNRYFQRMFEALMAAWVEGSLTHPEVESFADFHARVRAARDRIIDAEGSRRVLVFSSGGPIGVCVQLALEAPLAAAIKTNWRVKNGSLTEFIFSRGRLSLDAFNRIPHLDDPALQSFR
ncbi:MAG: histidine phosphatase family protein [Myxococcales bacterium]|nr:histidine phosphatase family protein [Myxococcales bacterium]